MKYDFAVFGATGMQGRIVTKDLIKSGYTVLMCGRDESRVKDLLKEFRGKTAFIHIDMEDKKSVIKAIKESGSKVIINCVWGEWNLIGLKDFIEAGVNSIDLGSDPPMVPKQLALGEQLKKKELIHITGCGSVPGIGDVMLEHAVDKFDTIDTVKAGFAWNSNIKKFVVPFCIESVLWEYALDAGYVHNKKKTKVQPSTTVVKAYHRAVGELNEFKVRHPETYTFYRYCKNKGVKNVEFYSGCPDHSLKVVQMLVDLGFAKLKPVKFKGREVWADEYLAELLKGLGYPKGYTETENLWVTIEGKSGGKNKKILMECIVPPLKGWEDAGCNIDTGMPASIIAQMIFKGEINKPGSYAPEDIVPVEPFFKELRKRKMLVYENGKIIN